jgi:hypothetical protein
VDPDILQVSTPARTVGLQRIVATSPDGESDALDAPFAAN